MKLELKQKFKGVITGYKKAFLSAPAAMILCAWIGLLLLVHHQVRNIPDDLYDVIERLIAVCVLGIPFSLLIEQWIYKSKLSETAKFIIQIAGIAFLVIYYLFGIPDFSMKTVTRTLTLFILSLLLYVLIYTRSNPENERFVLFLLKRGLFAGVYSLVIWGGVSFTFFAFSELMDIELWREPYWDFLFVTIGFIIPAYFFSGLPKDNLNDESDFSKFFVTLLSFILIPILIAYSAVIYIYFIRLLITLSWPEGILGHLVFWYALTGIAVMFFIRPFYDTKKITEFFYKFYPLIVLAPLVMMFISLGIRINAYGTTEPRYWVFIVGIWILVSMLLYVFGRKSEKINRNILLLLSVVCLISSVGPVSAYSVSKRSQNRQFDMLANKYDLYSENFNINDMSSGDKDKANSILRYFDFTHTINDLNLPEGVDKDFLKDKLNYHKKEEQFKYVNIISRENQSFFDVRNYDYLLGMYVQQFNVKSNDGTLYDIKITDEKEVIILQGDKTVYTKDLGELILAVYEDISKNERESTSIDKYTFEVPGDTMTFTDENEILKIKFFVQSAFLIVSESETAVQTATFNIAIKFKD